METNLSATDQTIKRFIERFQRNEITEYFVYRRLAAMTTGKNRETLLRIADDEQRHHRAWKKYTNNDVPPSRPLIGLYTTLAKVFGLTFAIRLMEKGEERAQRGYEQVLKTFPETQAIFADEHRHEFELIDIIREAKITYIGSIVLGLNDALVELTGALAGLSFALRDTKTVALAGLVTGLAASMSMAGSEYLSQKTEVQTDNRHPLRAAIYTGLAYVATVLLLILPFLLAKDYKVALAASLLIALLIIIAFTFFTSIVKNVSFKKKFIEMATISFSVSFISFAIGTVLRTVFNIDT